MMETTLHPISQKILTDFQPRKTKAQKQAFIDWLVPTLAKEEIYVWVENQRMLFNCNNLVIGDPYTCELIVSAHYDTAPVLPFPNLIFPRNPFLTILIQLLMLLILLAIAQLSLFGLVYQFKNMPFILFFVLQIGFPLLLFGLLFFGPANKHTANDNTSGVIAVLETILAMDPKERAKVCFVLFDLEEVGSIGSKLFYQKYPGKMRSTLQIDLDCVGDGDHIMLLPNRVVLKENPNLKMLLGGYFERAVFTNAKKELHFETARRISLPSDQHRFRYSVGVSAFHKIPVLGLFLGRIRSRWDNKLDPENIRIISQAINGYARTL